MKDGETQPVFSRADAVTQTVNIETTADSDRDGVRDRVQMRIMRPKETDTAGLKVPTILEPSPYCGINNVPNHPVDIGDAQRHALTSSARNLAEIFPGTTTTTSRRARGRRPRQHRDGRLDRLPHVRGPQRAGGRQGRGGLAERPRPRLGAGRDAGEGVLVHRQRRHDRPVLRRDAAEHGRRHRRRGLKAIVPIAGISSWYDYYRAGGGVVAPGGYQGEDLDVLAKAVLTRENPEVCEQVIDGIEAAQDRETGDYLKVWVERDYVGQARKVRAAVMVVHGLNDWNVKIKNSVQWWNALKKTGVPLKLWLHQGNHSTPFRWRVEEWLRQTLHWFDRYLYGIRNGIEHEPRVDVQHADGTWETARDWPVPGTRTVPLSLNAGPSGQPGALGLWPRHGETQSFVDAGKTRTAEQLLVNEDQADPNRLAYLTGPLPSAVRVDGIPSVSLRASLDGRSPYLTALLVDYGTDTRRMGAHVNTDEQSLRMANRYIQSVSS